jgi:hypothetical protein
MNQSLRRISLMTKNGGQKSRDTIPLNHLFIDTILGLKRTVGCHTPLASTWLGSPPHW